MEYNYALLIAAAVAIVGIVGMVMNANTGMTIVRGSVGNTITDGVAEMPPTNYECQKAGVQVALDCISWGDQNDLCENKVCNEMYDGADCSKMCESGARQYRQTPDFLNRFR